MVEQLKRVLNSVEEEMKSENSIWDKEQLISVVKPERIIYSFQKWKSVL